MESRDDDDGVVSLPLLLLLLPSLLAIVPCERESSIEGV